MCKLLENEGVEQVETDLELETSESIMHIRMSEEEWIATSQTHGLDHYCILLRWQQDGEQLNLWMRT